MVTVHPGVGVIGGPEDARIEKEQQRRGVQKRPTTEQPLVLAKAEETIRKLDKEIAYAYDKNGNLLFKQAGGRESVRFSPEQLRQMQGGVLTHNHPVGGTFSRNDIGMALHNQLAEVRAVDANYRYSFRIPEGNTLKWNDIAETHQKTLESHADLYRRRVLKGTMTVEQAAAEVEHHSWRFVAQKFGFEYKRTAWGE
jgi:hypothetical protein